MDMRLEVVVIPVSDAARSPCSIIFGTGVTSAAPGSVQGLHRPTYASFASFSDPDGNGWVLQEITSRLPGR
jgi:hypothetical protein